MRRFLVWLVALSLLFNVFLPVSSTRASTDVLIVGDKTYPVYQRGLYYSAWAEVSGDVHVQISAGGVSYETDISVDEEKLLVMYRESKSDQWNYKLLPVGPDSTIPKDTTFIVKGNLKVLLYQVQKLRSMSIRHAERLLNLR